MRSGAWDVVTRYGSLLGEEREILIGWLTMRFRSACAQVGLVRRVMLWATGNGCDRAWHARRFKYDIIMSE